jgi:NADH dehydrogenase (ubiquinone) 1 alpha subcomplex subunit 5
MRVASRLLASVKPGQFLEAGTPTGLTGLLTHNSPRSTLLYLYNSTLDKLQDIPESSVYRQSTEALTKHRLKIIEAAKPAGWDDWSAKIQEQIAADPKGFNAKQTSGGTMLSVSPREDIDPKLMASEWDGESVGKAFPEGIRSQATRRAYIAQLAGTKDYDPERANTQLKLDEEPQLTAEVYVDKDTFAMSCAN